MYYRTKIEDTVRIPPYRFDDPLEEVAIQTLNETYDGRLDKKLGLLICVDKIEEIGEGRLIMGDGASYHKVVFDAISTMNHGRTIYVIQHLGPRMTMAAFFFFVAIVIGVIATFMYSLSIYVRVDNPEMGVVEILKTARKIMHGRKLDLAVLCISFIHVSASGFVPPWYM